MPAQPGPGSDWRGAWRRRRRRRQAAGASGLCRAAPADRNPHGSLAQQSWTPDPIFSLKHLPASLHGDGAPVEWLPLLLQLSISQFGADPTGQQDVTDALNSYAVITNFNTPGIVFVSPGTYSVRKSTSLYKPVHFARGAVWDVAAGATVTLINGLAAGDYQIFTGAGNVVVTLSAPAILPEWFGEWRAPCVLGHAAR